MFTVKFFQFCCVFEKFYNRMLEEKNIIYIKKQQKDYPGTIIVCKDTEAWKRLFWNLQNNPKIGIKCTRGKMTEDREKIIKDFVC